MLKPFTLVLLRPSSFSNHELERPVVCLYQGNSRYSRFRSRINIKFVQVSCLPLMRRYLNNFLSLPDNEFTYIVSNLWTVNTQVLTAAVWLLFELIFSKDENEQIFEAHEIRELASRSLQFLQANENKSSIAKRGVGLIESLLDMDRAIKTGAREQFSLKEIISRVEAKDSHLGPSLSMESSSDPCFSQMSELLWGDSMAWEDILNVFGDM